MRDRFSAAFPVLLGLAVVLFLGGCNPFRDSTGRVELELGAGGGARTILPTVTVASYRISFSGPVVMAPVVTTDSNPTIDLEVGTWDISVEGRDSGGDTVAVGSASNVMVTAGDTTPVSIVLSAQSAGSGTIDVTVTWPGTVSPEVDTIEVTLDGAAVNPITLTSGGSPLTWVRYEEEMASGSYQLCFVLKSGTVLRASVQEAVQVYMNLTSSATIALTEADFTTVPAAPSGLVVAEGLGKLVLGWVENSPVATGYTIERGPDGSTWGVIDSISAPATSYDDTTATMGQTYYYQVKATNHLGASDPSGSASGKVEAPVPGGAGVLTFSDVTSSSIRVSWQKATDNVSAQATLQYKVVRSLSDNVQTVVDEANGTVVQDWTADIATVNAAGLSAGTAYYFNVLARDAAGNKSAYTSNSESTATLTITRIIDHTNFDPASVSDEDIETAVALDVYFEHASVGANICSGIDALGGRYISGRVSWSSTFNALWYDSSNGLGDNDRGNPVATLKISGFTNSMDASLGLLPSKIDVAMYKFCYIDTPGDGTTLFNTARTAMESLQLAYPDVEFVWWTMPLEQSSAPAERQEYNDAVRAYCVANNQWLLDIAALESHNDAGVPQLDGSNREILYSGYTSDGGHLNAAGSTKLANAYWKLLSEIGKLP